MRCLTDWKENSGARCGSSKIPAYPYQAFRNAQWLWQGDALCEPAIQWGSPWAQEDVSDYWFPHAPPGIKKEDVDNPWRLCVKMQRFIGNAHGEVHPQRAEKRFGNYTWQLCCPTSPFLFSLESGFSCCWGYCQGTRHKLKESNDSIDLVCLSGHVQIPKVENMSSEL